MAAPMPRVFRPAGGAEALRVAALGANLWAVALLVPVLEAGLPRGNALLELMLTVLPLLPLGVGAAAVAAGPRVAMLASRAQSLAIVASTALLVVYPFVLLAGVARRSDIAEQDGYGALLLAVASISLLAYAATAADACARRPALRSSQAQSLGTPLANAAKNTRARMRRVLLLGTTLGGLAVAVVAPSWGDRETLVRSWGDAADEAAVLASVLGTLAGCIALAGMIGPGLRAPRSKEVPLAQRRLRIAFGILAALGALAGFAVLRQMDG